MIDSSNEVVETPAVFEHEKRADWGIAVVAWETDEKRGYLFSDGELRVVARGYYDMMREVDRPLDQVEPLLARLSSFSGEPAPSSAANPAGFSFEDQLRYFTSLYASGFESDAWQKERRGGNGARRLKRHRDGAVTEAQTLLSQSSMDAKLSEHHYAELWGDLLRVAQGTDLVSKKQLSAVTTDNPEHLSELAKALRHLLYGEGELEARLQRFVNACHSVARKDLSWQIATLPAALVFPSEHVCVQPSSFREQARWLAPRLARRQTPDAAAYRRWLEMARLVSKKLTEAGMPPRDLLDVSDFIRLTTSPSARKAMLGFHYEESRLKAAAASGAEAA